MAAIPQYHAEQLASAMVGVPQANEAGAIMAKSQLANSQALTNTGLAAQRENIQQADANLTQDAGQMAHYAAVTAQQLQYDTNRTRAAQAARVKEQTEQLDAHQIESHKQIFDMAVQDKINELNKDPNIAPDSRADIVKNVTQGMQQDYIDQNNIKANQRVFNGFLKASDETIRSEYGKANTEVNKYRTEQTMSLQKVANAEAVKRVNTVVDFLELKNSLNDPNQLQKQTLAFGPKTAETLDTMLKGGAQQVLKNLSDGVEGLTPTPTPVAALEKLRETGILNGHLSDTDWEHALQHAHAQEAKAFSDVHASLDNKHTAVLNTVTQFHLEAELSDVHDKATIPQAQNRITQLNNILGKVKQEQVDGTQTLAPKYQGEIGKLQNEVENKIVTAIGTQQKIISATTHALASDAKAEKKEQLDELRTKLGLDTASRLLRQADSLARTQKKQEEQDTREAQQAIFDSPEAQKTQINLGTAIQDVIHGRPINVGLKTTQKILATDYEKLQNIKAASHLLAEAKDNGYLTSGAKSGSHKLYIGYAKLLNAQMDAIAAHAATPAKPPSSGGFMGWGAQNQTPQAIADYYKAVYAKPPSIYVQAQNPTNDPKKQLQLAHDWNSLLQTEIDAFKKDAKRQPEPNEVQGIIRKNAVLKGLGLKRFD